LVTLARYHRERGEFALAALYARQAVLIPRPSDLLFIDSATYDYAALDELSVSAYYAGPRDEGIAATKKLLASPSLPGDMRQRVQQNLAWYLGQAH
jgi:hypothetical protein